MGDVHYEIRLLIQTGSLFWGSTTITFKCDSEPSEVLWIDLTAKKVLMMTINGTKVQIDYAGSKIKLPNLQVGENTIEINYQAEISDSGDGLVKYEDPYDGEVYFYTCFAPFSAHKVIPCFDQPNLKCSANLQILTLNQWRVISNTAIENTQTEGDYENEHFIYSYRNFSDRYTLTRFSQTKCISPHLLFFAVGAWTKRITKSGEIPISLYCRQSNL